MSLSLLEISGGTRRTVSLGEPGARYLASTHRYGSTR